MISIFINFIVFFTLRFRLGYAGYKRFIFFGRSRIGTFFETCRHETWSCCFGHSWCDQYHEVIIFQLIYFFTFADPLRPSRLNFFRSVLCECFFKYNKWNSLTVSFDLKPTKFDNHKIVGIWLEFLKVRRLAIAAAKLNQSQHRDDNELDLYPW